jgi:BirA family biotin operon repressor/biotin-[acetyl-CoA-carboxylase] ligase
MAQDGSPEWTLILAERQTRGRGRMGRRWTSSKGGLYFSVIFRPQVSPKRLGDISLVAAKAAAKAVVAVSGLETAVKPPNDVLARPTSGTRSWKKVCGILIEASGGSSRTEWMVIGLGLNVNNHVPAKLSHAVSLRDLCGREFDLNAVLAQTLTELKSAYLSFSNGKNSWTSF